MENEQTEMWTLVFLLKVSVLYFYFLSKPYLHIEADGAHSFHEAFFEVTEQHWPLRRVHFPLVASDLSLGASKPPSL